jgi:hypothetical protein
LYLSDQAKHKLPLGIFYRFASIWTIRPEKHLILFATLLQKQVSLYQITK